MIALAESARISQVCNRPDCDPVFNLDSTRVQSIGTGQPETPATHDAASAGQLPAWCNVFGGMTDDDVADVDRVIRERANLTRPTD